MAESLHIFTKRSEFLASFGANIAVSKQKGGINVLDNLIKRLKPYHPHEIAAWSGLSLSTVENVISGRNDNPTLGTIQKLVRFANEKEKYNEHARKGDEA